MLMKVKKMLTVMLATAFAVSSHAAIISEYDSGVGTPSSPEGQGWYGTQVLEETPARPLATAVNTSGDGTLSNAGPGATGWIVRDYLDGQAGGQDDRPEYNYDLVAADFAGMASDGWRFTNVFKVDNAVDGREMRVLSLAQEVSDFLPFDIKVNALDDASGNLVLRMHLEDGDGEGTSTDFAAGVPASQFNTVIFEDVDGDGTFSISINGTPLQNTTDSSFIFDATAKGNGIAGDDVLVLGAESTGTDGGGIEYDLVRLETLAIPEPSSLALLSFVGIAFLGSRRVN